MVNFHVGKDFFANCDIGKLFLGKLLFAVLGGVLAGQQFQFMIDKLNQFDIFSNCGNGEEFIVAVTLGGLASGNRVSHSINLLKINFLFCKRCCPLYIYNYSTLKAICQHFFSKFFNFFLEWLPLTTWGSTC